MWVLQRWISPLRSGKENGKEGQESQLTAPGRDPAKEDSVVGP